MLRPNARRLASAAPRRPKRRRPAQERDYLQRLLLSLLYARSQFLVFTGVAAFLHCG